MKPVAPLSIAGLLAVVYALALVIGPSKAWAGAATGSIVYQANGTLYRIEPRPAAVPEDLIAALDAISTSALDEYVNVSPDGLWLLFSTERFAAECESDGWACLAVVASDFSSAEAIRSEGMDVVHSDSFSAIASGGNLVVFTSNDGPHEIDLWAISRNGGNWGSPILLTTASPGHAYYEHPAISDNGATVVFNCGPDPSGNGETGICIVETDGFGFAEILAFDGPDAPQDTLQIHHPDFAPDGSIVVEIDTGTETIWRLPGGMPPPVQIEASFTNDNSPCVLPDGRVVSLWLNGPGNDPGLHELKVMDADGSNEFRVLIGVDVSDSGIGCGGGGSTDGIFASGFETGNTSD